MGTSIEPSKIRGVHFAKQNITETLSESWDEEGLSFRGRIPPSVKVGDPLVVRPREGETWWLTVEGLDPAARKCRARITLVRVWDEVRYLQGEVRDALVRFAARGFPTPAYQYEVVLDPEPQRGVTLNVVGPPTDYRYGSQGKLTPKWVDLVLGNTPHERDNTHPYVSSIRVTDAGPVGDLRKYAIRAEIV